MKQENGYFTVEAAMVLPIVIGTIVVLIYLVIFQYNRCLMEQDMGALALKGCSIQEDKSALMLILEQYEDAIYPEKYIIWDRSDAQIKLEGEMVGVVQNGKLRFPFSRIHENNIEGFWSASAGYENQRVNPVGFIRMYRKLIGGM